MRWPPACLEGRSHPLEQGLTHTQTDIDIHPCTQTYIHAYIHPDIHGKSAISALLARKQPALAEPGTSNLCFRSQEEMLTGLKREEAFRYARSDSLRLSLSRYWPVCLVCLFRSICLGRLVSVYLFRSVCLGAFVSVCPSRSVSLCLGRAGQTAEHTHHVNNAVSPGLRMRPRCR